MRYQLKPSQVAEWVKDLRIMKGDDEAAHSREDEIHYEVLLAIAEDRCEDSVECARLATTTVHIEFSRWCA